MLRDEWNLSAREAARCSAALLPGERVLLLTRPRVQLPLVEVLSRLVPGVALVAGLGYMLWQLPGAWWLVAVIQLPFWLLAGFLLVSPRLQRRRRTRTLFAAATRSCSGVASLPADASSKLWLGKPASMGAKSRGGFDESTPTQGSATAPPCGEGASAYAYAHPWRSDRRQRQREHFQTLSQLN